MADATTTARIRLALEGASAVEQGLSKVQSKVSDVGKTLIGFAGGISAAGFAAWVKGAVDAADETSKMAQKTGLLTKEVAGLQLAFDQSGAGDKMQVTLSRLAKEAASGNSAFKAMGITVAGTDGKLKSTRVLLGEVADKFAGYRDGAEKTALAQELLGKTGADIIPTLNGGAAALAEFDDMAQRLGLTISEETAVQAEQFNDTLDLIGQSSQGVARQVAAQLLPTLTTLTQELFNNITQGDNLKKTADFLAGGLKGLYSVGVGVVEVFKTVGVALGGTGAAIAAIMSGEFGQAKEIVNQMRADISASWAASGASIRRVWDGAGSSTVSALAASSRAARENAPVVAAAAKASKAKASADKDAAKAAKELADTMAKVSSLSEKLSEQYIKDADSVMDSNQVLREEIELIGLTTSQRAALVEEKEAEIIVSKELELISLKNADADAVTLTNLEREIDLRKQRIGLLGQKTAAEGAAALAEADKKAFEDSAKAQAEAYADMWNSVDSTAHDVFVSVATEGEDAFKRIGKTLKAAVLDMLYQMTLKKWIFQISGQSTVGGGGNSWIDLAQKAYSAYTGGGGGAAAAGSAAAAYGTVNTTTLAGVEAASAGSTGAAGSAAAGSSAGWMTAAWYAAVVVAAVAVAENLYSKGYNRQALGAGGSQTVRFGQYSSYSTDPSIQKSQFYDKGILNLEAKNQRALQDALGFSEKWADILSGTTRMATLIGRKLGAYGYEANIAGGDASVSGFARYKGGLFRSNKTVGVDIDQRDAAAFDAVVESTIEGTRAMARAMGYSSEAIDAYTGKLRVNFKGANTAAEQAERMAKAMDDLQYSMLKAAAGGKYSRQEFDRLMESVRANIEAAGISSSDITSTLAQGAIGRMDASQVGAALSESIIGGIYNTIANNAMAPVADAFMAQIITPIFTAIMAGVPISQAVSQAAISNVVASAQSAAAALNTIFADPGFQSAIGQISGAINQVSRITVAPARHVKAFGSAVSSVSAAAQKAAEIAQERFGLETTLLNLLGNTAKLRERELAGINASNRALQRQIWTIEDAKAGMESAMDSLQRAIDRQRDLINERLDAANEAESKLNDVFGLLRDGIDGLRGSVASTALMQADQARALIQSAITSGIIPDSDKLSRAISAVSDSLENQRFASATERERAFMIAANQQDALLGIVEPQLSAAEQTVSLLESQLTSLDAQLQTAEDQMNALLGIDNSVRTVSVAVDMLNASMASYSAAIAGAIGIAVSSAAPAAASASGGGGGGFSYGGGSAASAGWNAAGYWSKNADLRDYYNANQNALNAQFGNRDAYLAWHWNNNGKAEKRRFAMGGAFTNGIVQRPTHFDIGQMGERTPEGILPLANIGGRLGVHANTGSDPETKALLRRLIEEVQMHRAETRATAVSTGKTAEVLNKVSQGGTSWAVHTLKNRPVETQEVTP